MARFRIERTELHTRVWIIDAPDEATALEQYMDEEDVEEYEYHSGQPDVRVEDVTVPDTMVDWRYEVANGDTRLGYDEWLAHKREDRVCTDSPDCGRLGCADCQRSYGPRG